MHHAPCTMHFQESTRGEAGIVAHARAHLGRLLLLLGGRSSFQTAGLVTSSSPCLSSCTVPQEFTSEGFRQPSFDCVHIVVEERFATYVVDLLLPPVLPFVVILAMACLSSILSAFCCSTLGTELGRRCPRMMVLAEHEMFDAAASTSALPDCCGECLLCVLCCRGI